MKNQTSDEIIDLIKNQNFNAYLKAIYKYLIPISKKVKRDYASGTNIQVEDIVQETVIRFHRYAIEGKIENSENIEGYLFVMAKNLVLNMIKKNKMQLVELSSEKKDSMIDDYLEIQNIELRANSLKEVLKKLSDACQSIINLYYYENTPLREIATLLDYNSEDVVKTKHYKCKQKLIQLINQTPNLKNTLKSF